VVTGLGCVTPLGIGVDATWKAALEGRSGIGPLAALEGSECPSRIGGEVQGELDLGDLSGKEARRFDRVISLAVAAARQAAAEACLSDGLDPDRCGVAFGSGIGGLSTLEASHSTIQSRGPKRVSPFTIPMIISNMSAGVLAIQHGLRGPNLCPVAACATGAQAIGEALRIIERGEADLMLVGGSESASTELGVSAFASMRALSTRNDAPEQASRPFDVDRDGFVIAEGAAALVLEAEEHARARAARARGGVLGYGLTADAHHITLPAADGKGPARCMEIAIRDAGLAPEDIEHLNAHATSTPSGDPAEARAVRTVFGAHADDLPVSATKSMTGHTLGAAGALEAIFCLLALEQGMLPPTINLDRPDPECPLDHVANKARPSRARVALSNSFGFGGTNACLVLGSV